MRITIENPRSADVMALIDEHLADMHATSPAESVHALDAAGLTGPSVTVWTARAEADGTLLGIGALTTHAVGTGEVKSMRTASAARGQGVASAILREIIAAARARGMRELNLETGTEDYFAPAHRLYLRHGFVPRGPFADYTDDPHSRYLTLALVPAADREHLPGGSGGVWRVGDTVLRPAGPWTPAVQRLLEWLTRQGLAGVPLPLGEDGEGHEIVSYLEGRSIPPDEEVPSDAALNEAAAWTREFHLLVQHYRPSDPQVWRQTGPEPVFLAEGQIVCHNDLGTYNWILRGGSFAGMIDWDQAGPGKAIDDVAFLCWTAVPLVREVPRGDVVRRLRIVASAYPRWSPETLLDAVAHRIGTSVERIASGARRGDPGMVKLEADGELQRTRDRLADFTARLPALREALRSGS